MNSDKNDLTPSEKINAQNEIDQMKLELDGATFFSADDAPPEMIAQFLKNIKNFEGNKDVPLITVLEHLGNPTLPTDLNKDSDEISILLASIHKLCEEKGLNIIKPDHLTEYGIYRFMMDDIMPHQFQSPLPGMTFVLDYDDFHKDSIFYLEKTAQAMVESIVDLKRPFDEDLLSETCRTVKDQIQKAQAIKSIAAFHDKYSEIIPISFSLFEKESEQGAIFQTFGVAWEGILNSSGKKESFRGMGICQLSLTDRRWLVEGVSFSGFDL